MQSHNRWPLDNSEQLMSTLQEQDATPDEIAELTPVLMRLSEWHAPTPTVLDTRRLLVHLTPHLPTFSPVRAAISARRRSVVKKCCWFIEIASVQASLLRPSFWLLTALIFCLGVLVIFSPFGGASVFLLRVTSPLIVYFGTVRMFRSSHLHTLEHELVCPPSPQQLILARLSIILGYDTLLGLCTSFLLWSHGGGNFLLLTLHWITPLLLVSGIALLLSLFISVTTAALLTYAVWLGRVMLTTKVFVYEGVTPLPLTSQMELLFALIGLVALFVVVLAQSIHAQRLLAQ